MLTRQDKKSIYENGGRSFIMAVGGKCYSDEDEVDAIEKEDDESQAKKAKLDSEDLLPVFWHSPSHLLVQELTHMYSCAGIIDLCAGAGMWAMAAMELNVPYFGVVLSPTHQTELKKFLLEIVKTMQSDETSALFQNQMSWRRRDSSRNLGMSNDPKPGSKDGDNKPRRGRKPKKDAGKNPSKVSSSSASSESE